MPGQKSASPTTGLVEKPTLKTIATATGLAVTTVSRALKDAPEIAEETRARVRAVANQIGYVPDRAAQRLRTGRTNVISFVLAPHEEIIGFGTSMIAGLAAVLRNTPYHLVVMPNFEGEDPVNPVRHILRNRLADAIIFARTEPLDPRVKLLLEHDFPFVSHGRTELATSHPFVDYDNYQFAYLATKRLIEKGRRKLVLINAPPAYTFSQHMRHGFMSAIRESGVAFEVAPDLTIESPPEEVRRFALSRFSAGNADGLVCGGEVSAMAVMAAIVDGGLAIGEDVDVVAKRTTPIFDQMRPAIDMIEEDLVAAARKLGDVILKRIDGADMAELQWIDQPVPMFRDD